MICVICFGAPLISGLAADNGLGIAYGTDAGRIFCAGESQSTATYHTYSHERTHCFWATVGSDRFIVGGEIKACYLLSKQLLSFIFLRTMGLNQ